MPRGRQATGLFSMVSRSLEEIDGGKKTRKE